MPGIPADLSILPAIWWGTRIRTSNESFLFVNILCHTKMLRAKLAACLVLACCYSSNLFALGVSVEVSGLDSDASNSLLNSVSLYQQREQTQLSEEHILRLMQIGIGELNKGMQAFGYFEAKTTATDHINDSGEREIIYTIEKGPQILVNRVDISFTGAGKDDEELKQWRKDFPLSVNSPLNQVEYENAKKNLFQIFHDKGFFAATLERHEIIVDPKKHSASIQLGINTGPQFSFGSIQFKQSDPVFDQKYLEKFLNINQGEAFSGKKLNELHQRLIASGEFSKIDIDADINKQVEYRVPVILALEPRKRSKYTVGIGYGTDTGSRIKLGVERRRITSSAHQISGEAVLAETQTSLKGNYRIPLTKPYSDYFLASGERFIEDIDSHYRQTNSVSFSANYRISNWLRSYLVSVESETFRISSEPEKHTRYVIPGINLSYIPENRSLKDRITPTLILKFKVSRENFYSEANLSQVYSHSQLNFRLTPRLSLETRLSAGFTNIEDINLLPASLRFFAGGDNSIRGFTYNSLGPTNAAGEVEGGKNLAVFSIEGRRKQGRNAEISVFFDTGNAYNQALLELESGAGVGFGWQFPFGVIRIYAASALTIAGNPWRLHLNLGAQL